VIGVPGSAGKAPVGRQDVPVPWLPPMDRDATFLLSLATFAVAACIVGICGWVIWSRGRAPRAAAAPNDHPPVAEES